MYDLLNERIVDYEERLKTQIRNSERTKYMTYRTMMNPNLTYPDFYSHIGEADDDEKKRITSTRFRLSSHNLAIERGRWSRTPRDQRLCSCGRVQDELHVISECPEHQEIRRQNPTVHFHLPELFQAEPVTLKRIVSEVMNDFV